MEIPEIIIRTVLACYPNVQGNLSVGLMIEVIENHLDDLVLFTNHIVAALGIADPELNTTP